MSLDEILTAFKSGDIDLDNARTQIRGSFFQDLGHSTLDSDRVQRTGAAEVIYGEHKTPNQIVELVQAMAEADQNTLVTRTTHPVFELVREQFPDAEYHELARAITLRQHEPDEVDSMIAVVTAGTSDVNVAEEAAVTAEFYGNPVVRIRDVGVAGIHRLLARMEDIRACRVVVVVAGMEGALPSVVGGLVDKPVIAVPTSVGYGAAFGGMTALLGMLTSCASGLSVVNIDNGFGAGYLANMINRL